MNGKLLIGTAALTGAAVIVGQLSAAGGDHRLIHSPSLGSGGDTLTGGGESIYDVAICKLGGGSGSQTDFDQYGKAGTFPDGSVGLSFGTTGHNAGTEELPWFVSTDVHHPVIGMNLYRINGEGRIEQIGLSWLKHTWFAVQGTACGSCDSSGSGSILGVGCADTYGGSLNADQYWLGPRWEIDPLQQIWMDGQTWNGSHFERNSQNGDSSGHASIQHRLRVRMGDLVDENSDYYYEGFYHFNREIGSQQWDDIFETSDNITNNMAFRGIIPNHNGNGNFSFANTGPAHTFGPVIQMWGDTHGRATPEDDGTLFVSSRAVDLGGGQYRYEYAVLNYNVTREVDSFSVPVPNSVDVTDFGFHSPNDGYWVDGEFVDETEDRYDFADWESSHSNGQVSFAAPDPGVEKDNPNTIRYGMTYTFWFTADAEPGTVTAAMTPHRDGGTVEEFNIDVRGPEAMGDPAGLDSVEVTEGVLLDGNLSSLLNSDNNRLRVNSEPGLTAFEPNVAEIEVDATSPHSNPSQVNVGVELALDNPGGTAKIRLFNHQSGEFDQVATYATQTTDDLTEVTVDSPGDYIGTNDEIIVRVRTVVAAPFTASGFVMRVDLVEFEVFE